MTLKHRPVGIYSLNPKPILLSVILAWVSPRSKLFLCVTGLGNTFIKQPRLEPVISKLTQLAGRRSSGAFFLNPEDAQLFIDKKIIAKEKVNWFIGPGVDLRKYNVKEKTTDVVSRVVIICAARLIWQKGIKEFVESARILKEKYKHDFSLEFRLFGEFDDEHPDGVPRDYILAAVDDGVISHCEWSADMVTEFAEADINVLHSCLLYTSPSPRDRG